MALLPPLSSRRVVLSVGAPPETSPASVDVFEVCSSAAAASSALRSGRRFSGILAADADAHLRAAATAAGVPVLSTLDDGPLAALADPGWDVARSDLSEESGGRVVAVCGTGGTGASTLAAALAAGGAGILEHVSQGEDRGRDAFGGRREPGSGSRVLLADLALRADQCRLHLLGEPACGLLKLIDIGRVRPLTDGDIRRGTQPADGYRLLAGLRRPAHWTAVAPEAFDGVLDGLQRHFDLVVADITGEFEGEAETGSADIDERNHMARHTVTNADVVLAVGRSGATGRRRLATLIDDLLDLGVEPARIQPVVGDAGAAAASPASLCGLPALPIPLPWRRPPEDAAREGAVGPVIDAVGLLVAQLPLLRRAPRLARLEPGTLGCALP